jgi:hypothetical protein
MVALKRILNCLIILIAVILAAATVLSHWGPVVVNGNAGVLALAPAAMGKVFRCPLIQAICTLPDDPLQDCICLGGGGIGPQRPRQELPGVTLAIAYLRFGVWSVGSAQHASGWPLFASERERTTPRSARFVAANLVFGFSLGFVEITGLILLTLRLMIGLIQKWVRDERQHRLRCRNCAYPLWGLTVPRCPECGLQFDSCLLLNRGRTLTFLSWDPLLTVQAGIAGWAVLWMLWLIEIAVAQPRWTHAHTWTIVAPTGMDVLPVPLAWLIHVSAPALLACTFWSCSLSWKGKALASLVVLASALLFLDSVHSAISHRLSMFGTRGWAIGRAATYMPSVGFYVMLGALLKRDARKPAVLMYGTAAAFTLSFLATLPKVVPWVSGLGAFPVLGVALGPPLLSIIATLTAWREIASVLREKRKLFPHE